MNGIKRNKFFFTPIAINDNDDDETTKMSMNAKYSQVIRIKAKKKTICDEV